MDAKDRTIDIDAKQFVELVKLAKKGDPAIQFAVGEYYRQSPGRIWADGKPIGWERPLAGNDVSDAWVEAKAVQWYRRSAKQNYAPAQNALGDAYAIGEGAERNPKIAVEWLRKAAEQGHLGAQSALGLAHWKGRGVEQSDERALELLRNAAEKGHTLSLRRVAYVFAEISALAESGATKDIERMQRAAAVIGIKIPGTPESSPTHPAPNSCIPHFGHG